MLNFKKLLCALVVVILATTMGIVASADSKVITAGDVSGDKSFDIVDLVRLSKYIDDKQTEIELNAIGYKSNTNITEEQLKTMRKVLLGIEKYKDITIYSDWGDRWDAGLNLPS